MEANHGNFRALPMFYRATGHGDLLEGCRQNEIRRRAILREIGADLRRIVRDRVVYTSAGVRPEG